MQIGVYISLAVSAILFLTLLFASYSFKRNVGDEFNIRQYFPYEAFEGEKSKTSFLRVIEILIILTNIFGNIALFFMDHDETLLSKYYFLILIGISTLLGVVILFISIIPLKEEKLHVFLFFALSALLAIENGAAGWIFIGAMKNSIDGGVLDMSFAIVAFLLAFLSFCPLINPKLKDYATLIPTTNEDGTVSMKRPKYFVMAFSEWLLLILNEISFILISLFSCFLK